MAVKAKTMSAAEVGKRLLVATRTVKKWCDSGRLPHSKRADGTYRITPAAFQAFRAEYGLKDWTEDKKKDTEQGEQCPQCKSPMIPRDVRHMSEEQRWCGQWFDCSSGKHFGTVTVLIPSPELVVQNAAQKQRAG